jgi:hypothetical protein
VEEAVQEVTKTRVSELNLSNTEAFYANDSIVGGILKFRGDILRKIREWKEKEEKAKKIELKYPTRI